MPRPEKCHLFFFLVFNFELKFHYLTWHCSSISEDLHRFARYLQHLLPKLFLLLILNNFKLTTPRNDNQNNFAFVANFLQICVNFQKYWNNVMSNDGLIIEFMDLSHIHLAVPTALYSDYDKSLSFSLPPLLFSEKVLGTY